MSSPISTPKGGGAVSGLGEKFSPDLFTGTGNFSVPIALPPGRNGFQPELGLQYSTGSGNSPFGLGWNLSVPGVMRKTAKGVPRYDETKDTFILSGAEDLVAVKKMNIRFVLNGTNDFNNNDAGIAPLNEESGIITQYRPRTEGLFARIYHLQSNLRNCWKVMSKNGLTSWYGSKEEFTSDKSLVSDPENSNKIFAWKLTRTEDTFGNHILYIYEHDAVNENDYHHWDQNYLKEIKYADYSLTPFGGTGTAYMVRVEFTYEERKDAFSDFKAGFEIRTTQRCKEINIYTNPEDGEIKTRTYHFQYSDEMLPEDERPYNGVALLCKVEVEGHDGATSEFLPPLEFRYTHFKPKQQKFKKLEGNQLPLASLANPGFELIDLFGNGLPDIVEINGLVRYWRNLGDGKFDIPRVMKDAPSGFNLGDPDVQLIDANGDGRTDLMVNGTNMAGYFSTKYGASWDAKAFKKYKQAPSFNLADPEVKMMDLTGDGITDALRNGASFECFFHDKNEGWTETRRVSKKQIAKFPNVSFADPRIKMADMTADGLQDIVHLHSGNVTYWPNLGYGNFAKPVVMKNSPRFQYPFDPARIQLADIDGDGLADLIYIDVNKITFWINQSGNGWSEPFEISGTPFVTNINGIRITDILGNGTSGVLYSFDALASTQQHRWFFLDLTGGVKPYLLHEMDNNMGALTRVNYLSSTRYYLADQYGMNPLDANSERKFNKRKPWKTTLPFPVQAVSRVEVIDELSKGKLATEYIYHHGYWDGGEREFRGFGRVDQRDTETFQRYTTPSVVPEHGVINQSFNSSFVGNNGEELQFNTIAEEYYSPPIETRNWFHLGPVGDEFGDWMEVDFREEYWQGNRQEGLADGTVLPPDIDTFRLIQSLPRRAKRDAYRAWRGSRLRSELYALDEYDSETNTYKPGANGIPYTVSESSYGLRLETSPVQQVNDDGDWFTESVLVIPKETSGYVFFSFATSSRTSQWERGIEPMTQLSFTTDYDEYGQPRKQLSVALSRGMVFTWDTDGTIVAPSSTIIPVEDGGGPMLSTASVTRYAQKDSKETYIVDRTCKAISYEIIQQTEDVFGLKTRVFSVELPTEVGNTIYPIIGCSINYYDGDAYIGLNFGNLGVHGAVTKTETLILTDQILQAAYGGIPEILKASPTWTSEYPIAFRNEMPNQLGYIYHNHSNDDFTPTGFYTSTKTKFDFQDGGIQDPKGLTIVTQDPFGNVTEVVFDDYKFEPITVIQLQTDGLDLVSEASYSYRNFQVLEMKEFNGNRVQYQYSPLGLLKATAQLGKSGETLGDDLEAKPGVKYDYDFLNFKMNSQPVYVKTTKRVYHVNDNDIPSGADADETIMTVEYTDGFGRLLQTRTLAEDVIFGNNIFGDSGLPELQGQNNDAIGIQRGVNDLLNVVVGGWKVYNNKGKEVEKYEPYFDRGFEFDSVTSVVGEKVKMFYDPRGNVIRTVNPDNAEQLVVRGIPNTLSTITVNSLGLLSGYICSPWISYTYDANDNGERTNSNSNTPSSHHNTPKSAIINALGNTIKAIEHDAHKNGTAYENVVMRYEYDVRGNLLKVTDALDRIAFVHLYDLKPKSKEEKDRGANILKTSHIDSGAKTIIYNSQFQPVEIRDAKDALMLSLFDTLNRPIKTYARDIGNEIVSQRQKIIYGDSNSSGLTGPENTNHLGRIYKHFDEAGLVTINGYDFKGNVLEKKREVIGDNEILNIFNGPPVDWQITPYTVNWDNTTTLEGNYVTTLAYDALNRIKQAIYPEDSDGKRKVMQPDYNKAGILEKVKVLDNIGGTETTYVEHIAYNAKGQRLLVAYGNGVMTRYAYNNETFRLTRLRSETYEQNGWTFSSLGSVKQDSGYAYDLAGNIVAIKERTTNCGVGGSSSLDRQFEYDPLYRLTSGTGRENIPTLTPIWDDSYRSDNDSLTTSYTQQYEYDKMGNILELQHSGGSSFTREFNYSINTSNRLNGIAIGSDDYTFNYDDCGNLTTENSDRNYRWNYADKMKCFFIQAGTSDPTKYAYYLYDTDGNRVKKIVRNQSGTYTSTVYIDDVFEHHTDGTNEQNILWIVDDKNRIASIRIGFSFGDTTPEIKYNLEDHLSNSLIEMADDGSNVSKEEFYPFGETSFGSYQKKRFKFCGKQKDNESGLYYYKARYYSAWFCRFVSVDPLALKYTQKTPYNYCSNSPTNRIDPSGLGDEPSNNSNGDEPETKFDQKVLNNVIENAKEGEKDSESTSAGEGGRNCDMCCLNALTSNLKQVFGSADVENGGTIREVMAEITANGLASPEIIVNPTNDGKKVTSKTGGEITDKTSTGVPDKLMALTKKEPGIYFFAVGLAAGYHSTIIAVVTNGASVTDAQGKTSIGTVDDPLFVLIEDYGGARNMNRDELGAKIKEYLASAKDYYAGKKPVGGSYFSNPTTDISLKGQIWQLYKNPEYTDVPIQKPVEKPSLWQRFIKWLGF